jgi:hypothetical protein
MEGIVLERHSAVHRLFGIDGRMSLFTVMILMSGLF